MTRVALRASDGGHDGVLGRRDRGLVEEHVGAVQRPAARAGSSSVDDVDSAPSASSASRCVSTRRRPMASPPGRRQLDLAAAREQRARQQQRGAEAPAQVGVELGGADAAARMRDEFGPSSRTLTPEVVEQRQHHVHVQDVGHVVQHDLLVGEEAGGQDRQSGVLVAARHDGAGQRAAAPDDQPVLAHVVGS